MSRHQFLLSPTKIGGLTAANRIVMPPMVIYQAGDDGLVTRKHVEHYKLCAGPGLVIVEGTAVLPEGRISRRQLGIYSERHVEGLCQLSKVIHENGAIAGIQIHHAGALAYIEKKGSRSKRLMLAILRWGRQQLMVSNLKRIREAFKAASRRAVEAGFEIIEIHAAHGYLFSQFLSPLKNWRIDRYGGKIENRRRLLFEVFQDIRSEVAGKALVTCRLGVADGHRRGLPLSEGLSTASELEKEGAEVLDISSGSGTPSNIRPQGSPFSGRLHLARAAKLALSIPVIGGGGIFHPDLAERALREGMADMIFVGRGILADPAWAQKTIEGRPEAIVPCRTCNGCFYYSDSTKCPARKKLSKSGY